MLTGQVACSALNPLRTLLSYNPDCSPLSASDQLITDLKVQEELAFAVLLELLLLATRDVYVRKRLPKRTTASVGYPRRKGNYYHSGMHASSDGPRPERAASESL